MFKFKLNPTQKNSIRNRQLLITQRNIKTCQEDVLTRVKSRLISGDRSGVLWPQSPSVLAAEAKTKTLSAFRPPPLIFGKIFERRGKWEVVKYMRAF